MPENTATAPTTRAMAHATQECDANSVIDAGRAVDLLLDIRLEAAGDTAAVDAALGAIGTRSLVPTDELRELLAAIEAAGA